MNTYKFILFLSMGFLNQMGQLEGHGMMLSPTGRSSRWRYDNSAPTNYDDNALYCGGFWVGVPLKNSKCSSLNDVLNPLETNRK
ncbi:GM23202 [Drosophila sechellia]|uniref:GM23202 n=1 Tax=Drosophila sechellia TaxID=7238 RepID=B4IIE2_DROSE|nr:GM23202 [Drosophila sechellia]